MAYKQKAFTFDAKQLHEKLLSYHTSDRSYDLHQLKQDIQNFPSSEPNNVALIFMRFDEEWFEYEHIEESAGELFLVFLASNLSSCESISENHRLNFQAIQMLLTEFGWAENEIQRLLHGDKLSSMVEIYAPDFLKLDTDIARVLYSHGGWLSNEKILKLAKQLDSISSEVNVQNPRMLTLLHTYSKQMTSKILRLTTDELVNAYQRTRVMLDTALQRGHDLYLIAD